ncbi:MAG TPA: lactate racemase domain-containing protein [Gemmatales bacterium]|nr:lactate racemase domain-containing protein [Gemmatales bacterium]
MIDVPLHIGSQKLDLKLSDGKLVQGRREATPSRLGDVRLATAACLETPTEFPALRLALTPDDHLTIIVHEQMNGLVEVLETVLKHVQTAGVQMNQITLLLPAEQPGVPRTWPEQLPADCQGFKLQEHQFDQSKLAYLASTQGGRRIYLNRHIVDADQLIIIGNVRFDPVYGVASGLADLYPAFSDAPTREELTRHLHDTVPLIDHPFPIWKETEEVGWQLGMPFVVCVVEGQGDAVTQVIAGSAGPVRQLAETLLRKNNIILMPYHVDLVVGTLVGAPNQQTFTQVTEAMFRASRGIHPGGSLAILSDAGGPLPPGSDIVSQAESAVAGLTFLRQHSHINRLPWWYLARAIDQSKAYLSSRFLSEVTESMFMVPLDAHRQVQNLIDQANTVMIVEGMDRCLLEMARPRH